MDDFLSLDRYNTEIPLSIRNRFFSLIHTAPAGLSIGMKNLRSDSILGMADIFIYLGTGS